MNNFYAQYRSIEPYLKKKDLKEDDIGKVAYHQTPEQRKLLVCYSTCHMVVHDIFCAIIDFFILAVHLSHNKTASCVGVKHMRSLIRKAV